MPRRWLQLLNFTDIVTLKFSYLRNADDWNWWFVTDAASGLHAAQALTRQPNLQDFVEEHLERSPQKTVAMSTPDMPEGAGSLWVIGRAGLAHFHQFP